MAKKFFSLGPSLYSLQKQNRKGHKNEIAFSVLAVLAYHHFFYNPAKANLQLRQTESRLWTDAKTLTGNSFSIQL